MFSWLGVSLASHCFARCFKHNKRKSIIKPYTDKGTIQKKKKHSVCLLVGQDIICLWESHYISLTYILILFYLNPLTCPHLWTKPCYPKMATLQNKQNAVITNNRSSYELILDRFYWFVHHRKGGFAQTLITVVFLRGCLVHFTDMNLT